MVKINVHLFLLFPSLIFIQSVVYFLVYIANPFFAQHSAHHRGGAVYCPFAKLKVYFYFFCLWAKPFIASVMNKLKFKKAIEMVIFKWGKVCLIHLGNG